MSTDPRRRPASVEEFQALLRGRPGPPVAESLAETVNFTEPIVQVMPVPAKPAPTVAAPRRRRILGLPRAVAAAVLVAVLVLAAVGGVIFLGSRQGADGSKKAASTVLEGGVPASIPTHPEQAGAQPPTGPVEQTPAPAASGSTGRLASVPPQPGQPPASGKNAPPPAGATVPPAGNSTSVQQPPGTTPPAPSPDQTANTAAPGDGRSVPLEISESELRAKCTQAVRPIYPPFLARSGVRGIVKLRVTLDETGRVAGVKPIEGNPMLTRLSEDAIRKCTFAPTLVAGKPVPVTGILTVAFPPRRQP